MKMKLIEIMLSDHSKVKKERKKIVERKGKRRF